MKKYENICIGDAIYCVLDNGLTISGILEEVNRSKHLIKIQFGNNSSFDIDTNAIKQLSRQQSPQAVVLGE